MEIRSERANYPNMLNHLDLKSFFFLILKKAVSIYDFLILLGKARNAVKLKDRISEN